MISILLCIYALYDSGCVEVSSPLIRGPLTRPLRGARRPSPLPHRVSHRSRFSVLLAVCGRSGKGGGPPGPGTYPPQAPVMSGASSPFTHTTRPLCPPSHSVFPVSPGGRSPHSLPVSSPGVGSSAQGFLGWQAGAKHSVITSPRSNGSNAVLKSMSRRRGGHVY